MRNVPSLAMIPSKNAKNQTENVKCQIAELKRYLDLLEYKLAFYQKAKALGSVKAVNLPQIPEKA